MNDNEILERIESLEKEIQELKKIVLNRIETPVQNVQKISESITTFYKLNDDEIKNLTGEIIYSSDFQIKDNILIRYTGNDSEVIIPDNITEIGNGAFNNCENLKKVNIIESVRKIGKSAFKNCHNIEKINIPYGVTEIDDWAFEGCGYLNEINIPDSVTKIGDYAFWGCEYLSISVPKNCTFGKDSFGYCENVVYRENKKSNNKINSDFQIENNILIKYTGNSKKVNIPHGITEIGKDAFKDCNNLQEINIPDSVTEIGAYAFKFCRSLAEINIPDGVTKIEDRAFYYCDNLQEITIPYGITEIGFGVFSFCTSLKEINLPDSVTEIGAYAFEFCSSLAEINIPDSVKKIGNKAFADCRNSVISVPKKCICGKDAFLHCKSTIRRR